MWKSICTQGWGVIKEQCRTLSALPEAIAAKQRSHSKDMTLPIKGRGRANSSQPHSRREHTLRGIENTDAPGPKTLSAKVMGREVIWGFGVALVRQTD